MSYNPLTIGQQPMSSSQGVVIASNQSPVSVAGTVNITGNPSISGTINIAGNPSVSGTIGASIVGQLPAGTAPLGSIAALQGTNPWTVVSSLAGGIFPVSGSVAATITNANVNVSGSVVGFQGTSPWITQFNNSSILAVPVGSVITLNQGSSILAVPTGSQIGVWQSPSIVATYAEDAASASADKGLFVLGVRNDTLTSMTSADLDYSSHIVGPAGEMITANSPLTKWVSGTASMLGGLPATGSLVPIIAAQGSSIFTYITAVQIANASANNAWITLLGGTNSVIGYTVSPASGGSNIYYPNALKTNANAAFSASISAVASVYLSAQGFISKT